MGPVLMTGLTCFGSAVAIGLLTTSTLRPTQPTGDIAVSRGFAVALIAMANGSGVLGAVVGIIGVVRDLPDPSPDLLPAIPAMVGAVVGLGLIARHLSELDRVISIVGLLFVVGMGLLGLDVAVLALVLEDTGAAASSDWPFAILGVVSGVSALGIGVRGASSIRAIWGVDMATAHAMRASGISSVLPFLVVTVGASAIAILLVTRG